MQSLITIYIWFFSLSSLEIRIDIFYLIIFWLQDGGEVSVSSEKIAHSRLHGNDASLQGSSDMIYDISNSPLADFHHSERLQQGVPSKVCHFLATSHSL